MITQQGAHNPPLEYPASFDPFIVVLCLALVAAELLVRTAIPYPVTAFQTHGDMSLMLLVSHQQFPFILANISLMLLISNSLDIVFPFLIEHFSVFYNHGDIKINLITLKKIFT